MDSFFIYNIRKAKYSKYLSGSGFANRWNKDLEYVIYGGSSIALAALELVAHRSSIQIGLDYALMFIHLKVYKKDITKIELSTLPNNWKTLESYSKLQSIGSNWYKEQTSLLLEVPSVLVPWESNFIVNTTHPEFKKRVRLEKTEVFSWDNRLL